MDSQEVRGLMEAYSEVYAPIDELYKGKHGQSETEYQDSRSDAGKQISGDSRHSGAAYSHRSFKGIGKPAKPGERQEHQGRMTDADRNELAIRKANLKKEEYVDEAKWIQKAIKKPGALHKQLGVPEDENIPAKKLAAAAKKGGKLGKRARLAQTLSGFHEEYDVYDIVINHLLDEGYADTQEAALTIMANMSEEWRDSILEAAPTTKTPSGQTVTADKGYPATLGGQKGMKSYGRSGTEYFTPFSDASKDTGINTTDLTKAKFKSVASQQYEPLPKDQSSHLRTGIPKVNDLTKYDPRYKPPGMRKPSYRTPTTSINPKSDY